MNRRDFLKLMAVAPVAPSVLAAVPKVKVATVTAKAGFTVAELRQWIKTAEIFDKNSDFFIFAPNLLYEALKKEGQISEKCIDTSRGPL